MREPTPLHHLLFALGNAAFVTCFFRFWSRPLHGIFWGWCFLAFNPDSRFNIQTTAAGHGAERASSLFTLSITSISVILMAIYSFFR